jgi:hypothetical protein
MKPVICFCAAFSVAGAVGCGKKSEPTSEAEVSGGAKTPPPSRGETSPPQPKKTGFDRLDRPTFNQMAVRLNLGVFWRSDANNNETVEPGEIVDLSFYPPHPRWVESGKLTDDFVKAYERMVKEAEGKWFQGQKLDPREKARRKLVRKELDQGRPTLVFNDLSKLPEVERKLVAKLLQAAKKIDGLYAKQNGIENLAKKIPAGDTASKSLLRRNWSAECKGPRTEKIEACSAIPGGWKRVVDVYPAEIQKKAGFCEELAKHKKAKELLAPFVVVGKAKDGKLRAQPYNEVYELYMEPIAKDLEAAAKLLGSPEKSKEKALISYLTKAAEAFRKNSWFEADEAWAEMSALNSKWYLRVGPDEVYWDPCNRKAGFHLTLARINPESLEWQKKLTKVRQEMEDSLAKMIGAPYRARKVSFQMPDFVDIVINAGDDRKPFGATIGQSLPNWGPVAKKGSGRTIAMSNLYTDPDSLRIHRMKAESLLSSDSMKSFPEKGGLELLGIMLHEAAHNLGPSHEYKVKGKVDDEIFGGPLATVMEELKAQTAALHFVGFLTKKGVIDEKKATEAYVNAILWTFGHISRGMYNTAGKPKPYSQVSAIQVGFLMDEGVMTYDPKAKAANGKDEGCFTLHLDKLPKAAEKLMQLVGRIKAQGDKAKAAELIKKYVDSKLVPQKAIAERILRYPKASFVYAIEL